MELRVVYLSGELLASVTADETWTISTLKARVGECPGLPQNSVVDALMFEGEPLTESETILSVGLNSDTVLQAVIRQCPPEVEELGAWPSKHESMCTCDPDLPYSYCYVHRPNCFAGDTPVRMADGGCKPIAKVKAGDRVKSFDVASGNEILGTVVEALRSAHAIPGWQSSVFRHEGTGATETFVHTPQHEWLTNITTDAALDGDKINDDAAVSVRDRKLRLGWGNMETPEEFDMRMRATQASSNNRTCSKWSRALKPGDQVVGSSGKSWTLMSSSRMPSAQKHVTYNLVVEGYGSSANLFSVGSEGGLFVMGKPGGHNPLTHQGGL